MNKDKTRIENEVIFDWLFFPIWSFENIPYVGNIVTIPLDVLSIALDNIDILMEFFAPLVPLAMDILLDIGQAVPGYGTAISFVALPLNFIEQPLEESLANFTDILGMFINIARKDWELAYMSALAGIPVFADLMDSFLGNSQTANKWLRKINSELENIDIIMATINNNVNNYIPIIKRISSDPSIIFDPKELFEKIILPNKKLLGLENIPEKDINLFFNKIISYKDNYKKLEQNANIYMKDPERFIFDIRFKITRIT